MTVSKDSIYELINAPTQVMKQHFVEYFSGDALDTYRWNEFGAIGSRTYAMSDSVNGGFTITHSATNNDWGGINFDDIRPYSHTGSVIIGVVKKTYGGNTGGGGHFGLSASGQGDTTQNNTCECCFDSGQSSFFNLLTDGTGTAVSTNSDVTLNENWNCVKVEQKNGSAELTLNGILKVTYSGSEQSTTNMQPSYYGIKRTTNSGRYLSIRYCEAMNT